MTTIPRQPIERAMSRCRGWHARMRTYAMAVAINVAVTAAPPAGRLASSPPQVAVAPELDQPFHPCEVGGPAVIVTLPIAAAVTAPPVVGFDLN